MTKTLATTLVAATAFAAASFLTLASASALVGAGEGPQAPRTHVEDTAGNDYGYPIGSRPCLPAVSFKPGACAPGAHIFQPL